MSTYPGLTPDRPHSDRGQGAEPGHGPAHDHGPPQAHGHAHGHGHAHDHGSFLGRLLELDADVHADMLTAATARVAEVAEGQVRRVLDIGSGVGTGTIALAHRFPEAEIVAVDISEGMLSQVRDRAQAAGVGDRVTTRRADIAASDDDLGPADVVWASASLHETSDPDAAFGNLFAALRPGGLLAVLEMDAAPRVLPAELADWEEQVRAAGGGTPADHPDWTEQIATAGFEAPHTYSLVTDLRAAADGPAGEYAALELQRIGARALPSLEQKDQETLRALAGDGVGSVRELGELWIRGTRTLWTTHRP
ncbi:class I SAM-dependent methyltransferase [Brachybacterium sp. AOP3-A1-3]|uniref:class I SAM-dependent methyltransferase n=1 Tax=Brachybacterium sp. AOP3-A1-3 TaxID=3457699 RepID=UPI0040336986